MIRPFPRTRLIYQQHHDATNSENIWDSSDPAQSDNSAVDVSPILSTQGVEQVELTSPKKAMEKAGGIVDLVSPHKLMN